MINLKLVESDKVKLIRMTQVPEKQLPLDEPSYLGRYLRNPTDEHQIEVAQGREGL